MHIPEVTRFAPSPSGRLHLGHVLAARIALKEAEESGGKCYLRIEDLDQTRCRPGFIEGIMEDMNWLGFSFEPEIFIQSKRFDLYGKACKSLKERELVYPCFCSRKQVAEELARMNEAPQGSSLESYPGICRGLSERDRKKRIEAGEPHSWRLDCRKAAAITGPLSWKDRRHGAFLCRPESIGDVILARKDCPASYHLAVVVDDAAQGISLVTRGEDLLSSTHVHRLLQELLGYPVPEWLHHRLIRDQGGKRLAKRDNAASLDEFRKKGYKPEDILEWLEIED